MPPSIDNNNSKIRTEAYSLVPRSESSEFFHKLEVKELSRESVSYIRITSLRQRCVQVSF